ncbi:MAG: type III polyketide synthase, partial [Zoogloea sp.]|nr:type III polyketide synthase [Zoogloea sp.]
MNAPFSAVLGGFTPVQVAKPVPQRLTLELSAYGFARAHCVSHDISDKEGFRKVHREVKEKFDKYALTPSQIKRRQLIFFPRLTDIRFVDGHFDLAEPEQKHLQLYDLKGDPRGADLKTRHDSYSKVVCESMEQLFKDTYRAPDDVIHV